MHGTERSGLAAAGLDRLDALSCPWLAGGAYHSAGGFPTAFPHPLLPRPVTVLIVGHVYLVGIEAGGQAEPIAAFRGAEVVADLLVQD